MSRMMDRQEQAKEIRTTRAVRATEVFRRYATSRPQSPPKNTGLDPCPGPGGLPGLYEEKKHASTTNIRTQRFDHPIARTALAAGAALAIAVLLAFAGESDIDIGRLVAGASGAPRVVVVHGEIANVGDGAAQNVEITAPSYRLIGNVAAGARVPAPAGDLTIRYEWEENGKVLHTQRIFRVPQTRDEPRGSRIAGEPSVPAAPPGVRASYDPATHMLTVESDRRIEVWSDGFLLRPVARTDRGGEEYRYVPSNTLVLGQSLVQGETVEMEVVFTRPQDYFSIPLYAREPGKPPAYFTVSVAAGAGGNP